MIMSDDCLLKDCAGTTNHERELDQNEQCVIFCFTDLNWLCMRLPSIRIVCVLLEVVAHGANVLSHLSMC